MILFILDDLGTEKLGCYDGLLGEDSLVYAPTPALDALMQAQPSVVFTNAYVNPTCKPTRAAIQSGRYRYRVGTTVLAEEEKLIPELLKLADGTLEAGYFGKYHASDPNEDPLGHPLRHGYNTFLGTKGNLQGGGQDHFNWTREDGLGGTSPQTTWSGNVTADDAKAWIATRELSGTPYFACVAFHAPHEPLQFPPHRLATQTLASRYPLSPGDPYYNSYVNAQGVPTGIPTKKTMAPDRDCTDDITQRERVNFLDAIIEATDTNIAEVLEVVDLSNTLLIFIGDNGTTRDSVDYRMGLHDPNHAKGTLFQLGVRVPLIITGPMIPAVGPGSQHPFHIVDDLISGVDLWSTIADARGVDPEAFFDGVEPEPGQDSISFLDLLEDPIGATGARGFAISETFSPFSVWRSIVARDPLCTGTGDLYKFMYREFEQSAPLTDLRFELFYDLGSDPREQTNECDGMVYSPACNPYFVQLSEACEGTSCDPVRQILEAALDLLP